MQKNNTLTVKRLCLMAILIALFVVFDMLSIRLGSSIKITFGGLPIIIAAIFLGSTRGTIVGLVGAFIGQLLSFGLTPMTFIWIIPAGVRGLLMGILFYYVFKRSFKWQHISISIVITSIVVTILNTGAIYLDSLVYGYPFEGAIVVIGMRFVSSIITSIVYILIIMPIILALKKQGNNFLIKKD